MSFESFSKKPFGFGFAPPLGLGGFGRAPGCRATGTKSLLCCAPVNTSRPFTILCSCGMGRYLPEMARRAAGRYCR